MVCHWALCVLRCADEGFVLTLPVNQFCNMSVSVPQLALWSPCYRPLCPSLLQSHVIVPGLIRSVLSICPLPGASSHLYQSFCSPVTENHSVLFRDIFFWGAVHRKRPYVVLSVMSINTTDIKTCLCVLNRASSWYLNKGWPTRWHLLYYILLNMFQTLIRPFSGASEFLLCCVGCNDRGFVC